MNVCEENEIGGCMRMEEMGGKGVRVQTFGVEGEGMVMEHSSSRTRVASGVGRPFAATVAMCVCTACRRTSVNCTDRTSVLSLPNPTMPWRNLPVDGYAPDGKVR